MYSSADLVLLPYERYVTKKQYGLQKQLSAFFFVVEGHLGVPLQFARSGNLHRLDGRDTPMFEGCGTKITYVVKVSVRLHLNTLIIHLSSHAQIVDYDTLKVQKYSRIRRHGSYVSNSREKVVSQVANVMEEYIQLVSI